MRAGDILFSSAAAPRVSTTWSALSSIRLVLSEAAGFVNGGHYRTKMLKSHADGALTGGGAGLSNAATLPAGDEIFYVYRAGAFMIISRLRRAGCNQALSGESMRLDLRAHTAAGCHRSIGWERGI